MGGLSSELPASGLPGAGTAGVACHAQLLPLLLPGTGLGSSSLTEPSLLPFYSDSGFALPKRLQPFAFHMLFLQENCLSSSLDIVAWVLNKSEHCEETRNAASSDSARTCSSLH